MKTLNRIVVSIAGILLISVVGPIVHTLSFVGALVCVVLGSALIVIALPVSSGGRNIE